jgi:hypothetical protein
MPSPSKGVTVYLVEASGDLVKETTDELGIDLLPGLAESRRGDGIRSGERDLVVETLIPEGIKKGLVAAPAGVGDQVEEQSDEDLEGKGAAAGEVLLAIPKDARFRGGQEV